MSEVGFFGLVVAPGKKEKVTPPEGRVLRLSSAALDVREKVAIVVTFSSLTTTTQKSADAHATLMISVGPQEFVLANFTAKSQTQTALDLFFAPGMDVFFSVHGNASVHLVGYVTVSSFDGAGADGGEGEGLSDMEEQEGDDKEDERMPPSKLFVSFALFIACCRHHEPAARASGRRRRRR